MTATWAVACSSAVAWLRARSQQRGHKGKWGDSQTCSPVLEDRARGDPADVCGAARACTELRQPWGLTGNGGVWGVQGRGQSAPPPPPHTGWEQAESDSIARTERGRGLRMVGGWRKRGVLSRAGAHQQPGQVQVGGRLRTFQGTGKPKRINTG